ncbi:presenilin-2-like [Ornithodoros turicata]|uniref:presenilin-2-like n=1 Tax=Ornithodoros turicata TaxID=34597 RepID=UPI003138769D
MPYSNFQPSSSFPANLLLMNSFGNAFSFLAMVVIVNCTLVLLYKEGHTNIIKGWLMTGSALLLSVTTYHYFGRVLIYFNIPLDLLSVVVIVYNLAVTGLMCLYYKGPFLMQQTYLVYVSVLMSLVLVESFPTWTAWMLLALISLWDIFAVLCVVGPLKILLETAKERNEPLFPALVFSTSSVWCYSVIVPTVICASCTTAAGNVKNSAEPQQCSTTQAASPTPQPNRASSPDRGVDVTPPMSTAAVRATLGSRAIKTRSRHSDARQEQNVCPRCRQRVLQQRDREAETGMKMGLGDFVFYSVLMGSAARNATVGVVLFCYVFIIVGIFLTMALLLMFQQPLPALPMSIALGLFAYFGSTYFVGSYLEALYYVGL